MNHNLCAVFDTAQMQKIAAFIDSAVWSSYDSDRPKMQNKTEAETKRRVGLCIDMVKTLRGDLQWSIPRIGDHLSNLLRARLDGKEWLPGTQRVWLPNA